MINCDQNRMQIVNDGWYAGTVHDYTLVSGSNASSSTALSDITQADRFQSTSARSVEDTVSTSTVLLTPPPRPPPPRVSPQYRELHSSSLPPALPPKERHGTTLTTAADKSSSSHLPPPLPQPRHKNKETSPTSCSIKSIVADRLASKVVPPLPVDVDADDTQHKVDISSTPSSVTAAESLSVPKCERHDLLGLGTSANGMKGKTVPSTSCDWPLDAASVSSSRKPLGLPLDRASASECSVCLEQPIDCVLYMCGHMCMCHECAVGVYNAGPQGGSCPICRQTIKDVIKIYRSW